MTTPFHEPEFDDLILSRSQVLTAMVLTAALLLSVSAVWAWLGSVAGIPLQVSWLALGQGILVGLGLTGLSAGVYRLWPAYRRAAEHYMRLVLTPLAWPDMILLGVLPGLAEEVLFRGVALAALGVTPLSVGLTSLIFGILHILDRRFWPYGVWATVIGVLMALSFIVTHNLGVAIVAHTLTNIIAGCSWKYSSQTKLNP